MIEQFAAVHALITSMFIIIGQVVEKDDIPTPVLLMLVLTILSTPITLITYAIYISGVIQ
jgi:hypothetical protein|tara:strand:+ start:2445 stop:2624 length:180 start_codon:yes stop_codon:yes gene_type:complete